MKIMSPSSFCFTGSSFPIKPVSLCLLLGVTIESLLLLFCCFPNLFWFILYIPCSLLVCLFFTLEHGIPSNNLCRASSAGIAALNSLLLCNFLSPLIKTGSFSGYSSSCCPLGFRTWRTSVQVTVGFKVSVETLGAPWRLRHVNLGVSGQFHIDYDFQACQGRE